MKKRINLQTLSFLLCATLFVACSSDDNPIEDKVEIPTGKEIIEVSDYGSEETVTFNATADWNISVNEITTRSANWVTVSPMKGGAGESTITITITDTEYDGEEDRTAEIIITAGNGTPVKIYVVQKGSVHNVKILPKRVKSITKIRIANEDDLYTAAEYKYTDIMSFGYDAQNRVKEIKVESEEKLDCYREDLNDDSYQFRRFYKEEESIEGSLQIEYSDNQIEITSSSNYDSYSYKKSMYRDWTILNEQDIEPEWTPIYGWTNWSDWEIDESTEYVTYFSDHKYTLSDNKVTSLSHTSKHNSKDNEELRDDISEEAEYTYIDNRISTFNGVEHEHSNDYYYNYNYIWSYGNIYQIADKDEYEYTRSFYYDGYHFNNLNIDLWYFLEYEISQNSLDIAKLISIIGRRSKELPVKSEGHNSTQKLEYTTTFTYTKDSDGYITEILAEGLPEGMTFNGTDSPTYRYSITYE